MSNKIAPAPEGLTVETVDSVSGPPSPVKHRLVTPRGNEVVSRSTSRTQPEPRAKPSSYDELMAEMGGGSSEVQDLDPEVMNKDVALLQNRMRNMGKGLINPRGKMMMYWDFFTLGALFFTATITPYEVCMMWAEKKYTDPTEEWLDWLFITNIFINLIFIVDMGFNFFLPYKESIKKGGGMVKSHKRIATNYLKSWFPLDLLSILPVDYVMMALDTSTIKNASTLSMVRLVRLMRLIKLARILRASRIFSRWENQISLTFGFQSLIKLFIFIFMMLHWLACILGLMAQLDAGAMRNDGLSAAVQATIDAGDATCFGCTPSIFATGGRESICRAPCLTPCEASTLAQMRLGSQYSSAAFDTQMNLIGAQEAWVCRYAAAGKIRPMPIYHGDVYWAALYVAMIQLGGGVGSIVPENLEEYILFWFCIFVGSVTWAAVVGTICAVLTTSQPDKLQFQTDMDSLNYFLSDMDMPNEIRVRCREYLRNKRDLYTKDQYGSLMDLLSPDLRVEVVLRMSGKMLKRVWYLEGLEDAFLVELSLRIQRAVYAPREKVPSDRLNILMRGVAAKAGNILTPITFWGEDIIVTSKALRDKRNASALTYVEIASLDKATMDEVLESFPKSKADVQEAAMKIAMQRAIVVVSEFIKLTRERAAGAASSSTLFNMLAEHKDASGGQLDGAHIIPMITGQPFRDPDEEVEAEVEAEVGAAVGGEAMHAVMKRLSEHGSAQKALETKVDKMAAQLDTIVGLIKSQSASAPA